DLLAVDRNYKECLPFRLTAAQENAITEIRADLDSPLPMHRLLQGDVGSGKTVVAFYPLLAAAMRGGQGAFMAPTEVLARQHFDLLESFLRSITITPVFLPAGLGAKAVKARLEDPDAHIIVGTHALIQERVVFRDLRVCVIDEQHKFGVRQRWNLKSKGADPDVLVMTATPIPRSLALTLYGELDVTTIDTLPPGRRPVETFSVPRLGDEGLTQWLDQEIRTGGRVFFVCPLVNASEKLDLEAAVRLHERIEKKYRPLCRTALLHGSMSAQAKESALDSFRSGQACLLVTTVVVEVGVDVPEASTVIILDAWRFGLAQLHQIRGRVGRGDRPSRCYLVGDPPTEAGRMRIRIIEQTTNGFKIAEEDLKMRGPGEALGLKQHGLPALKAGDYIADVDLMTAARDDARAFVASSSQPPVEELLMYSVPPDGPWIG
ncbi:MAG: DEAD/DEAH box helicase, partial [Planctomycetota bacterium]